MAGHAYILYYRDTFALPVVKRKQPIHGLLAQHPHTAGSLFVQRYFLTSAQTPLEKYKVKTSKS